jgi:hypothetical protein
MNFSIKLYRIYNKLTMADKSNTDTDKSSKSSKSDKVENMSMRETVRRRMARANTYTELKKAARESDILAAAYRQQKKGNNDAVLVAKLLFS